MSLGAKAIDRLNERFPAGSIVGGIVEYHASFGFFVDLSVSEAVGLVRIVDIVDEPRPLTQADFPPVGSAIDARVLNIDFGPPARPRARAQVILSIKPSLV